MNPKSAIKAIDKAGALLVFPLDNRAEPASLWSCFYPKDKMRWEWDDSGDGRVVRLWHLKTELSTTRQVVYTKWYRGRATYLSRELFTAMLRALNPEKGMKESLSPHARDLLGILESESPLSTKELKRMSGLQGRANERVYEKALQELWARLLIVAYGEVEDGAFPSLAVGSARVLFEDLWSQAFSTNPVEADRKVRDALPEKNLFLKHYAKLRAKSAAAEPVSKAKKAKHGNDAAKPTAAKVGKVVRFEDL